MMRTCYSNKTAIKQLDKKYQGIFIFVPIICDLSEIIIHAINYDVYIFYQGFEVGKLPLAIYSNSNLKIP